MEGLKKEGDFTQRLGEIPFLNGNHFVFSL